MDPDAPNAILSLILSACTKKAKKYREAAFSSLELVNKRSCYLKAVVNFVSFLINRCTTRLEILFWVSLSMYLHEVVGEYVAFEGVLVQDGFKE